MSHSETDGDGLVIRDAAVADAAVIAEIYNETIATRYGTMDLVTKTPEMMAGQIRDFDSRETIVLLERNDDIIGWGIIKKYSHRVGYQFCAETSVFLRHSEIRKGYGSYIKAELIERCKKYGYHHLIARIWASNTASIEYNKRFGYEMVGIQREIGYVDGQWQDVVVMQLVLDDVPPEVPKEF